MTWTHGDALVPADPSETGPEGRREPGGYLQITVSESGRLIVRGSPALVRWLLQRLTEQGWQFEIDHRKRCG